MFDGKLVNIKPDDIIPNTDQPRKTFDEYELGHLIESIKENGLLQPLTVRPNGNGKYILIAGERRLRAAKMAGLKKVPCIIRKTDKITADIYTVVENLQRSDLSPFEEAEGINRLIKVHGLTHAEAAEKLGLAQSTLEDKLGLLKLDKDMQKRLIAARLTERHARAILRLPEEKRESALDYIIASQLTLTETENYVYNILNPKPEPIRKCAISDHRLFENSLFKMVETLKQGGINATTALNETENNLNYIITIPKLK